LRQAYDYWQDQPGNYFPDAPPKRRKRPVLATFDSRFPGREFSLDDRRLGHSSSRLSAQERTCVPKPAAEPPCSPVSHISSTLLPVAAKRQRSWPSERTTNNRHSVERRTVAADSRVVSCNRFSYQQVIHILRSLRTPEVLDLRRQRKSPEGPSQLARLRSIPSQYILIDRRIDNSVQDKPVFP
jgi:hypothetical protein